MLRALIAGVLAVSSAVACGKSKGDAPTVPVGTAAGKVIELSGKVTATREGATRELALGTEVFADDQVETAADATVTIELFHNNARWAVVSNKKQRVDASLAWGLDKQQATETVEHNSAAAGRNAERSAAETGATTAAQQATAAAAEAAPEMEMRTRGEPTGVAAPPPPPPKPAAAPAEDKKRDAPIAVGGKSAPSAPPKLKTAKEADGIARPMNERAADHSAALKALLEPKRAELKKCLDPQAPNVRIDVRVEGGKATVTLAGDGNLTDKVRSCAANVVSKLDLSAIASGSYAVDFR